MVRNGGCPGIPAQHTVAGHSGFFSFVHFDQFERNNPMANKQDYLKETIEHISIERHNVVPLVDSMRRMAFTSRDLYRASDIYTACSTTKNAESFSAWPAPSSAPA